MNNQNKLYQIKTLKHSEITYYLIFLSQVSLSCFRDVYIENKTDMLVKQTSICVLNYVFSAVDKAKDCGAWSHPDITPMPHSMITAVYM